MTIAVALDRLRDEIEHFGPAGYLLTVAADGRAHCVSVAVKWTGDRLVMSAGTRTLANARARPLVSLLWAPHEPGGYNLIVDGNADVDAPTNSVSVTPTNAVLHRNAAAPDTSSSCGSDCLPLTDVAS